MPGPVIDRYTRSRHNSFTSVRLNRLAEFRDDAGWLAQSLASPQAHFVPLWRGLNLLAERDGEQFAVYLKAEEISISATDTPPTLLGTDDKRIYFAVSLDNRQKEAVMAQRDAAAFLDLRLASVDMDAKHAGVLAYAKALLYWQYRHAFCGICGGANRLESAGHKLVCSEPGCARASFPRIDPAIIVLVTHGDACLLGRNSSWPERRFSALAGFVEPGESLEDAVAREVYEEAAVELEKIHYVSSQPWPFPASAMCGFYAEAANRNCAVSDEIEELRWVNPQQLRAAVRDGSIRMSPSVSIAFRLLSDWYQKQCGGDLEELARESGSWVARKSIK
jgi:NAD+ diphosphatase